MLYQKQSEVGSANASGTQALKQKGLGYKHNTTRKGEGDSVSSHGEETGK